MYKNLVVALFLLLIFQSCEKEKPIVSEEFQFQSGQTIWVLNEGNFQSGNASISLINRTSGEVIQNITQKVNGFPLGDVLQSALMVNGKVWLTVNNSGKIIVVNPTNFKIEKTIEAIGSPRYMYHYGDEVFVSDFQTQTLHIFNAASFQKVAEIYTGGWSEQMALVGNELWLTMVNKNKIYCINPSTRIITDSISTYDQPLNITTDTQGHVWVLCGGNIFPRTAANLVSYNAVSKTEINRFEFQNTTFKPSRLTKNSAGDSLFWIYDGVFAHSINSTNFPVSSIIAANGRNFYGLSYDSATKHLWLSDAKNYVQQGEVFELNQNGEVLRTFAAGIIPGDFFFY
jgi:hypothetical protein